MSDTINFELYSLSIFEKEWKFNPDKTCQALEVYDWLKKNSKKAFRIHYNSKQGERSIWFCDKNDAFLFKLRWC